MGKVFPHRLDGLRGSIHKDRVLGPAAERLDAHLAGAGKQVQKVLPST